LLRVPHLCPPSRLWPPRLKGSRSAERHRVWAILRRFALSAAKFDRLLGCRRSITTRTSILGRTSSQGYRRAPLLRQLVRPLHQCRWVCHYSISQGPNPPARFTAVTWRNVALASLSRGGPSTDPPQGSRGQAPWARRRASGDGPKTSAAS